MINQIITLVSLLQWQDVLDILLTSYILFRFYVLFRGTYVFRVLIGLTLLWFFQQIAVYLGLIVTSWVIQGIVAVSAFIIIVIFRNEIRSVLQARNIRSILWGFSTKLRAAPIDIVTEAVFEMSRQKIGALIVFPGREDISELTRNSIPWKGQVSREMIVSIFWPNSPVHDGAAIIQGDQVTAVGAILPLSQQDKLPSYYGTRHRAALGLSESSDAIVIVVSEERGNITLAKRSRLREILSRSKLQQKLEEHFGIAPPEGESVQRERLEFVAAALVSIIFISAVWFGISKGKDTLVALDVPVEYTNRKPEMEIVNTSVNSLNLELSGSGALIKSIRPEQVQVKLDLSNAVVGENAFTVTAKNISLPPGIILKKVIPAEVSVELDVTIEKELPVQVDWVGKMPENRLVVEVTVTPSTVKVVGGQRILEKISTIYTEKVPVDNLKEKGNLTANLALNPVSLKISGPRENVTIQYQTAPREDLEALPTAE
jgi:uncharacterized protein (TIGR00159 family)